VVQTLLAALIDANIKRYALRGLGNVTDAGEDVRNNLFFCFFLLFNVSLLTLLLLLAYK